MFRREHRRFAWVVLALLLCTAVVVLQESFVHSDDGCAVELHCIACRWAFSATVLLVEAPTLAASWIAVYDVRPISVVVREDAPLRRPASRGPPAA